MNKNLNNIFVNKNHRREKNYSKYLSDIIFRYIYIIYILISDILYYFLTYGNENGMNIDDISSCYTSRKKKEEETFSCERFLKNNSLIVEIVEHHFNYPRQNNMLLFIPFIFVYNATINFLSLVSFYLFFLIAYIHTSHYLYLFKSY